MFAIAESKPDDCDTYGQHIKLGSTGARFKGITVATYDAL